MVTRAGSGRSVGSGMGHSGWTPTLGEQSHLCPGLQLALGTGSKPISVSEQEGPLPPRLSEFLLIATTLDLLSQASCL